MIQRKVSVVCKNSLETLKLKCLSVVTAYILSSSQVRSKNFIRVNNTRVEVLSEFFGRNAVKAVNFRKKCGDCGDQKLTTKYRIS